MKDDEHNNTLPPKLLMSGGDSPLEETCLIPTYLIGWDGGSGMVFGEKGGHGEEMHLRDTVRQPWYEALS